MQKVLALIGSITGIAGVLVCLIAGLARVGGFYYVWGYEATTLFSAGTGLMIFACLARLEEIRAASRDN